MGDSRHPTHLQTLYIKIAFYSLSGLRGFICGRFWRGDTFSKTLDEVGRSGRSVPNEWSHLDPSRQSVQFWFPKSRQWICATSSRVPPCRFDGSRIHEARPASLQERFQTNAPCFFPWEPFWGGVLFPLTGLVISRASSCHVGSAWYNPLPGSDFVTRT